MSRCRPEQHGWHRSRLLQPMRHRQNSRGSHQHRRRITTSQSTPKSSPRCLVSSQTVVTACRLQCPSSRPSSLRRSKRISSSECNLTDLMPCLLRLLVPPGRPLSLPPHPQPPCHPPHHQPPHHQPPCHPPRWQPPYQPPCHQPCHPPCHLPCHPLHHQPPHHQQPCHPLRHQPPYQPPYHLPCRPPYHPPHHQPPHITSRRATCLIVPPPSPPLRHQPPCHLHHHPQCRPSYHQPLCHTPHCQPPYRLKRPPRPAWSAIVSKHHLPYHPLRLQHSQLHRPPQHAQCHRPDSPALPPNHLGRRPRTSHQSCRSLYHQPKAPPPPPTAQVVCASGRWSTTLRFEMCDRPLLLPKTGSLS